VDGQLHAPAGFTPGKKPQVPIGQETGCASKPVWTIWISENSSIYLESNSEPSILHTVVSHYTYCTTAVLKNNSIQFIYVQNLTAQRTITKLAQARKWE
jgi:hypothetical protein